MVEAFRHAIEHLDSRTFGSGESRRRRMDSSTTQSGLSMRFRPGSLGTASICGRSMALITKSTAYQLSAAIGRLISLNN